MARKIEDIQLDIKEVKQLIMTAKRPSNQQILAKHLSALKSQIQVLTPPKIQPVKVQKPKQQNKTQSNVRFTALTKYSWDQEGSKVKIYFMLDDIGNQCTANQIQVKFQKQSLEVKIFNYKKINYIFAIKKLAGTIDTDCCKYLVKKNSLSIVLIKKQSKSWAELNFKQQKFKQQEKEQPGKQKDPQASLMNMMKKMYDQGDDNMKKTIAQAWTKSQDKKGKPDMDMPGMGGLGGQMPNFKNLGKNLGKKNKQNLDLDQAD